MLERVLAAIPLPRSVVIIVHDVSVIVLSLPLTLWLVGLEGFGPDGAMSGLVVLPTLVVASIVTALAVGSHRGVWRYMGNAEFMRVALFAFIAIGAGHGLHALVDSRQWVTGAVPVVQFLLATFLLLTSRMVYSEAMRWSPGGLDGTVPPERVLLVGSGDGAALFQHLAAHEPHPHYEVVGILSNGHGRNRTIGGVPVLGSLAELKRVLATLRVQDMMPTRIIVTCPHHIVGRQAVYEVMQHARAEGVPILQLPDLMRLRHRHRPADSDVPDAAAGLRDLALYPGVKRGSDVLVAGLALVVCAPLLLLIAVMVAATIQRPVLFVQIRPGVGRRPFRLWKFRTMRDPIGEDGRLLSDDERTPWFGHLLRRSRLDELPQLWNVLNGDMALIGPRPLLAADLDRMADGGVARCRIRPGITGWAQVNGGHQLTADEKLALDLWYAENATFRLDALIVARTLDMMLWGERRNTEAIASALGHRSVVAIAAE